MRIQQKLHEIHEKCILTGQKKELKTHVNKNKTMKSNKAIFT